MSILQTQEHLHSVQFVFHYIELSDYCETDALNANCQRGEAVVIKQVPFGRMELGTCLRRSFGYMIATSRSCLLRDF